MSVLSTLRSLMLFTAVSLSLVGCKQADGEVCDVDSDCETGLSCCGGGEALVRGLCQPEAAECRSRPDDAGPDSGPPPDAGPSPDAGPRDAGPTDAAPSDAAASDAAASDAATDGGEPPMDAGTDAGTIEDAGSDAGDAS